MTFPLRLRDNAVGVFMDALLETQLLGRTVGTIVLSLGVSVGGIVLALLIRAVSISVIRRRRSHRPTGAAPEADETAEVGAAPASFAEDTVRGFVTPSLLLVAVYGGVSVLALEGRARSITNAALVILFSFVLIRFIVRVLNQLFETAVTKHGPESTTRIRPLRSVATVLVWLIGLLFLLDNLGFNVSAVVAGLGIGGIAIALAAQALLGDLFAYFVILFDRPFELGDFLIFGDILGSVESIGVKTTKIRSLGGEQIIVSNSDLTNSRVRNYKRMNERRIVFGVDVVYGTPAELVARIPDMLREAVAQEGLARFDRAHFASYADWSLHFEVVYYILSPDYNLYMDVQQRINLSILRRFEAEGVEFAFPTRTIEISRDGADRLETGSDAQDSPFRGRPR